MSTSCLRRCIKASADAEILRYLISPNTTHRHTSKQHPGLENYPFFVFFSSSYLRMNKLLMLAFLVTVMGMMATAAPQEEVDEMELEEFDMEEAIESREAREAGRRRK